LCRASKHWRRKIRFQREEVHPNLIAKGVKSFRTAQESIAQLGFSLLEFGYSEECEARGGDEGGQERIDDRQCFWNSPS
jgi:hypothetical protein